MAMNHLDLKNKLQEFHAYIKLSGDSRVSVSKLWESYRYDFSVVKDKNQKLIFKSNLRDYGVNKYIPDSKIDAYMSITHLTRRTLVSISNLFDGLVRKLVSLLFFKQLTPPLWLDCPAGSSKPLLTRTIAGGKERYLSKFRSLGWNYSDNSFKSYFYFAKLSELISIRDLNGKNILEIGSGMCNFAMILMDELSEFNYICLDLPELIPAACLSVHENFCTHDLDVFLPHELQDSISSTSTRKLTFITPQQLQELNGGIDLFVNHESFAEMPINVVNKYLADVKRVCRSGALFYLVNRFARQTNRLSLKYDSYTFFENYNLRDLSPIYKEVDELRAYRVGNENRENVIYLGRLSHD